INWRIDDDKMAAGAKAATHFVQGSPVIRRVMNGRIENCKIETRRAEWQLVKLRFHNWGTVAVAAGSAQPIHGVRKNIQRHRPMLPESKPIRHPAISSSEIEHI